MDVSRHVWLSQVCIWEEFRDFVHFGSVAWHRAFHTDDIPRVPKPGIMQAYVNYKTIMQWVFLFCQVFDQRYMNCRALLQHFYHWFVLYITLTGLISWLCVEHLFYVCSPKGSLNSDIVSILSRRWILAPYIFY